MADPNGLLDPNPGGDRHRPSGGDGSDVPWGRSYGFGEASSPADSTAKSPGSRAVGASSGAWSGRSNVAGIAEVTGGHVDADGWALPGLAPDTGFFDLTPTSASKSASGSNTGSRRSAGSTSGDATAADAGSAAERAERAEAKKRAAAQRAAAREAAQAEKARAYAARVAAYDALPTVASVAAPAGTLTSPTAGIFAGTSSGATGTDSGASTDLPGLSDDDLLRFAAVWEREGSRLDVLRAQVAAEVAERSRKELGGNSLAYRRGCRNPIELLERVTQVSARTATKRVKLGADIRPRSTLTGQPVPAVFPTIGKALTDGAIGVDTAQAIVENIKPTLPVAGPELVSAAEKLLVELAVGDNNSIPREPVKLFV